MTRIWVDENILGAEELLSTLGDVTRFSGRSLSRDMLADVDALLVRSVTRVDATLLEGTPVRFVGSTTIGTDHLDIPWLESKGIRWCNAPGSNAHSVVDYCLSAYCVIPNLLETLLDGGRVGIIGYGNVGSRLHRRLAALGVDCVAYDPLLGEGQCSILRPLKEVLRSSVVSVHTPLTREGDYATWHMLTAADLDQLPDSAVLLNAGRGEVLDTELLKRWKQRRPDVRLVLDVWENEPDIDTALAKMCVLATPHIAGYSQDGKWQGLLQVGQQLYDCLDAVMPSVPEPAFLVVRPVLDVSGIQDRASAIRAAVLAAYDIRNDDSALRQVLAIGNGPGEGFDRLRKTYPPRREISAVAYMGEEQLSASLGEVLHALRVR